MEIKTINTGSYPRIRDDFEHQEVRRAYTKWEKREISPAELEEVYISAVREIIKEQVSAGIDVVTDGLVRWYDQISHIARKMENVEIGGLLRFLDTNTYFRQPIIKEPPRFREPIILDEWQKASRDSPKPVNAVITGPYTLARGSIIQGDYPFQDLVVDYARVLSQEIEGLSNAGCRWIQIDEPYILKFKEDIPFLKEVFKGLIKGKGASEIMLFVYFNDITSCIDQLLDGPWDILGFDVTYSENLSETIKTIKPDKTLCFGFIDARNTYLEQEKEAFSFLDSILPHLRGEKVLFGPSAGLEYLPRDRAFEKLCNMVSLLSKYFHNGT